MKTANQVKYYHWRGVNQAGKKISGVTLGYKEQDVRETLQRQLINIKKIKHRKPSTFAKRKNQMTRLDVTKVTRQLTTMINSGVPVVQSFKLIADSHNKAEVRAMLTQITAEIEAGSTISQSLRNTSPLFDSFYCDLVSTGEQTGHLGELFNRIADY